MILVATSVEDAASRTILERLLRRGDWEEVGTFDGNPAYQRGERTLVTLKDSHLYRDHLDTEVRGALGVTADLAIYASRHRSESGTRSLTVHPIGNYGEAELGGKTGKLVPAASHWMTQALRLLRERATSLEYSVSFETTHHGPYLETPAFYIEVGSDEAAWADGEAASAIAGVILEVESVEYPVAIGLGGGHYAPRMTDVALDRRLSFGHLVPSHTLERLGESMLRQVVEKSPGASLAYIHRKAVKAALRKRVVEMVESEGLKIVRQSDLDPVDR